MKNHIFPITRSVSLQAQALCDFDSRLNLLIHRSQSPKTDGEITARGPLGCDEILIPESLEEVVIHVSKTWKRRQEDVFAVEDSDGFGAYLAVDARQAWLVSFRLLV